MFEKKVINTIFIVTIFSVIISDVQAEFYLVANHPEARAWYPSVEYRGRTIKVLRAYNDRIYMGFGQDDEPPVGGVFLPLEIRYIDADDQISASQGVLKSQEMSTMEVMQGNLFIPSEDWEGHDFSKCDDYYCASTSFYGTERSHHVYATAEYNGDIYMAGSSGFSPNPCTATLWKSSNGGSSWSIARTMSVDNGYPGCARFSFVGVVGNKLFVQGYQYNWSEEDDGPPCYSSSTCDWRLRPDVHTLDGGNWSVSTSSPILTTNLSSRTASFKGEIIFNDSSSYLGWISSFDGVSKKRIRDDVSNFTVTEDFLYVLTKSKDVYRSDDLSSWQYIDQAPSNAYSIEVSNDNEVYVGTTNGQVLKSTISEPVQFEFIKYKNYLIPIKSN